MNRWVDTHSHLNDPAFADDLHEVIQRMKEAGVDRTVINGYDFISSVRAVSMAEANEGFVAAVGVHPHDAKLYDEQIETELERMTANHKVVAIGEIGLDYHYDYSPRELQREVFRKQIGMARKVGLPIIIHEREATADLLQILQEERAGEIGGVLHSFSGSAEVAKIVLDMGFYIGIGGPVTFSNARKLPEVVPVIPEDRLVLETDCPYLTPHPHRGKRNEPSYIPLIGEKIALMLGLAPEVVADRTTANAERLFRL